MKYAVRVYSLCQHRRLCHISFQMCWRNLAEAIAPLPGQPVSFKRRWGMCMLPLPVSCAEPSLLQPGQLHAQKGAMPSVRWDRACASINCGSILQSWPPNFFINQNCCAVAGHDHHHWWRRLRGRGGEGRPGGQDEPHLNRRRRLPGAAGGQGGHPS